MKPSTDFRGVCKDCGTKLWPVTNEPGCDFCPKCDGEPGVIDGHKLANTVLKEKLLAMVDAFEPILTAYKSEPGHIKATEIEAAWKAWDAAKFVRKDASE